MSIIGRDSAGIKNFLNLSISDERPPIKDLHRKEDQRNGLAGSNLAYCLREKYCFHLTTCARHVVDYLITKTGFELHSGYQDYFGP